MTEMPSILFETGTGQVIPKSKQVDREGSPTISNSGAGDPRGGLMKRPAASLRYPVNWNKKDNSVAIRREHGDRHQLVSVGKRFWSESALRKLSERGISMPEPPSLKLWFRTMMTGETLTIVFLEPRKRSHELNASL